MCRLGQAPNHDDFYMLPHTVNALNVPLENRLVFPAAPLKVYLTASDDELRGMGLSLAEMQPHYDAAEGFIQIWGLPIEVGARIASTR